MSDEINDEDDIPTRVMKTSLQRLVMDNSHKQILINVIDKLVLWNSKIAVRGSMIMNYQVVKCIEDGTALPPIDQGSLYKAFNWNHKNAISEQLPEIKSRIPDPIENMDGKHWLIDYLVRQYMANIKSSIRGKYNSVIKQSIKGHIKACLIIDNPPQAMYSPPQK